MNSPTARNLKVELHTFMVYLFVEMNIYLLVAFCHK